MKVVIIIAVIAIGCAIYGWSGKSSATAEKAGTAVVEFGKSVGGDAIDGLGKVAGKVADSAKAYGLKATKAERSK